MAGPGIMIPALADTTERRMKRAKERYSFTEVVDKVRNGPPPISIYAFPKFGHQLNTTEYFVHHEDVRRAQPTYDVRTLPAEQQAGLWKSVRLGREDDDPKGARAAWCSGSRTGRRPSRSGRPSWGR